jgi:hypothetical protein
MKEGGGSLGNGGGRAGEIRNRQFCSSHPPESPLTIRPALPLSHPARGRQQGRRRAAPRPTRPRARPPPAARGPAPSPTRSEPPGLRDAGHAGGRWAGGAEPQWLRRPPADFGPGPRAELAPKGSSRPAAKASPDHPDVCFPSRKLESESLHASGAAPGSPRLRGGLRAPETEPVLPLRIGAAPRPPRSPCPSRGGHRRGPAPAGGYRNRTRRGKTPRHAPISRQARGPAGRS